MKTKTWTYYLLFCAVFALHLNVHAQKFVHPGLNQNRADLALMKKQVNNRVEPYKTAFERLKVKVDLSKEFPLIAHVSIGGYNTNDRGGKALSAAANLAYDCALLWSITDDKKFATKAIEILNQVASTIWDFDDNNAKLTSSIAITKLCNAAEILRYTPSGWQQKDIAVFSDNLMTVYYPLLRYYFSRANGNWDGYIISANLCIAVFTDNKPLFDSALEHFKYAPRNGSLFKYVYPSGQCQESLRDQGHVQMGLDAFALAARIAYTQGVDLFSIADNRLALGFEYTAKFVAGEMPFSYGPLSERAKHFGRDYFYVVNHYAHHGIDMPYSKIAIDTLLKKEDTPILTSQRAWQTTKRTTLKAPQPGKIAYPAGALVETTTTLSSNALIVEVGESLQAALDKAAQIGGVVIAKAGVHILTKRLQMPSNVTLSGEGVKTVLFLKPETGNERDVIVQANEDMHDVTIQNLVVECSNRVDLPEDPNTNRSYQNKWTKGGIVLLGTGKMNNIKLENVTVQNATTNGLFISGAENVTIKDCNLSENGADIIPGHRIQHNLLISHCRNVKITGTRMVTSAYGCGLALTKCQQVKVNNCEVARNDWYGILLSECEDVTISDCLVEGNSRSGILLEYLSQGSKNITLQNNTIHYNAGNGIEAYAVKNLQYPNNKCVGNQQQAVKINPEKILIMK